MYFIKIPLQNNSSSKSLKNVDFILDDILHKMFSYLHSYQSFKGLIRHSFKVAGKKYVHLSAYLYKKKHRKNKPETR